VSQLAVVGCLARVVIFVDNVSKHDDMAMTCSVSNTLCTIVAVEAVVRGITFFFGRCMKCRGNKKRRRELRFLIENCVASRIISTVRNAPRDQEFVG